jgi:uncharacterized membrane protein
LGLARWGDMDHTGHPFDDTALRASTRFGVELVAWVFAAWWAATSIGTAAAVGVTVVLVSVPAVASVPGDKHQVVVAVPGSVRVSIEVVLYLVAAVAPTAVVSWWPTITASVAVGAVVQLGRWRRLAHG